MNSFHCFASRMAGCLAVALAVSWPASSSRANIYATDIKINGALTNVPGAIGSPAIISYRLNETNASFVTVNILNGTNVVASLPGGKKRGTNSVSWTPPSGGFYSVSITAATPGYPFWTQTSLDTNPGNYAYYPKGMAVDCNPSSPYYGRVVVGCPTEGNPTTGPQKGVYQYDGIYKMNADGSFADEGGFGNGGYTLSNGGTASVYPNAMPKTGSVDCPWLLRVGGDDRIYMLDYSGLGAIVAFDMQMKTNQVVIDEGSQNGSHLGGASTYADCPDFADLVDGVNCFDVTGGGTTNAAVWLGDSDYPSWGVWVFHMTNGVADPNDTVGIQAVATGGDLNLNSSGGLMVDTNLDVFLSQNRANAGDSALRQMVFTNWNFGILPPESTDPNSAGAGAYAMGNAVGEVLWGAGSDDSTDTGIRDTVIDSRTNPKYVATPMNNTLSEGIRVLNAVDGSVVSVTNETSVQTLTNLDAPHIYTCAAWDNVGNLYGASTTINVWRTWSPPGANTNTTLAVPLLVIPQPFAITGISSTLTAPGGATVSITFNGPASYAASAFTLLGSASASGPFTPVAGATITGGGGSFQATAAATGPAHFYIIEE